MPTRGCTTDALELLRIILRMDLSHCIAYRILAALRMALFDGFARGVPARQRGHHTGKLAATAMGDVEKLEFFYAHTVAQLAGAAALLLGGSDRTRSTVMPRWLNHSTARTSTAVAVWAVSSSWISA